jgi:ribosomal-protein-alanine N-acetyltransferase
MGSGFLSEKFRTLGNSQEHGQSSPVAISERWSRTLLPIVIQPNQGKTRWSWGIFLKEDLNELVGTIELFELSGFENRGFWLAKNLWGQGLMSEAVVPVTDFAFNEVGFARLQFGNAVGNDRSRRIKEKTGARRIGTRPFEFVDPTFTKIEL